MKYQNICMRELLPLPILFWHCAFLNGKSRGNVQQSNISIIRLWHKNLLLISGIQYRFFFFLSLSRSSSYNHGFQSIIAFIFFPCLRPFFEFSKLCSAIISDTRPLYLRFYPRLQIKKKTERWRKRERTKKYVN